MGSLGRASLFSVMIPTQAARLFHGCDVCLAVSHVDLFHSMTVMASRSSLKLISLSRCLTGEFVAFAVHGSLRSAFITVKLSNSQHEFGGSIGWSRASCAAPTQQNLLLRFRTSMISDTVMAPAR